jgi:hypothetical protein
MDLVIILHAASTWALFGLIWTVQLVLYPQFGRVGKEAFPSYHTAHMSGVAVVVAPLMLLEIGTAAWLLVIGGVRDGVFGVSVVFLMLNWVSTALIQVPLHRRLEREGFEPDTCRQLTRSNWIRTVAWTLRAVLVGIWLR